MVGKKNGVEILQVFGNRVGNFFGRRSAVFRDGNAAERDNRFGHYGLSQRNTRDREGRSVNGVSVNYRFYVGSFFINSHVHLDFGRGFETGVCLKDFAVLVDFADVFGGHETLRYARGGAEEFVVVKFYGNVTVVGGNHALTVNSLADFANLFFDFEFVYHIYLLNNLSIIFFRFLYFLFAFALRHCVNAELKVSF